MEKVLDIQNLHATFTIQKKDYEVLHDISFSINRNETVCVVGESGCGKSVTTLCIMQLLPNNGKIQSGKIVLDGTDLTQVNRKEIRKYRGKKMGMIFQEPMTALNPLLTIGYQMRESIMLHRGLKKKEANELAVSYLQKVGIANPESRLKQYPFQLSGGLRQRILIAMVLSAQPDLLIADEPTTALDCVVQQQVLDLFVQLNQTRHVAIIMISHNLDLLRAYCSRVYVMYAGRIVESGNADAVFNDPKHPYTKALLSLIPGLEVDKTKPLAELPGMVPEKDRDRTSCIFAPRCPKAADACGQTIQPMDDNDRYILCPFADSKPKEVA